MHCILGYGTIGRLLAKELVDAEQSVRIVRRSNTGEATTFDVIYANLTDLPNVRAAIAGATVVYLVVGIEYRTDVWREQWPLVMANVISACSEVSARLVFLDNTYLYGREVKNMTEITPIRPCSEKGLIRAQVVIMLKNAVEKGKIDALIARSASFYGPNAVTGFTAPMVFARLAKRQSPFWPICAKVRHSLSYTPDIAKALRVLGCTKEAYNDSWHLPTNIDALTGEQFGGFVAEAFGLQKPVKTLGEVTMTIGGLFSRLIRESLEMNYQYKTEYVFDSTKFERRFFCATPYAEGIRETVMCTYASQN
jgi:nucleoside-diphosphate-sugar epimerase